uniref:GYF domain-containing protein n=1 Tax=Lepeophtheirus salmonis TaxID=72036 RepID=A0A0K2U6J5_LEPSM
MAETSMNFGPEWIRTLTERGSHSKGGVSGGRGEMSNSSRCSTSSRSALGEVKFYSSSWGPRYTKEEMLDRVRSMFGGPEEEPDENVMFPPKYLDKDYTRCDPTLWFKKEDEDPDVGGPGLPANSDASLRFYKKEGLLSTLAEDPLGDPPFERHRSLDASHSSKGPRSYERSMSDRGGRSKWYDRPTAEEKFNGVSSPRKAYTRVPFDDWRKTPTKNEDEWRNIRQPNRWSVWRSPSEGDATFRKYEFSKSNAISPSSKNPKWRDESSFKLVSRTGTNFSSRGGAHSSAFRRRHESIDTLPEWAHDDVPIEKIGGSFDSAGKFQQPIKLMENDNYLMNPEKDKGSPKGDLIEEQHDGEDKNYQIGNHHQVQESPYASNGNENHDGGGEKPDRFINLSKKDIQSSIELESASSEVILSDNPDKVSNNSLTNHVEVVTKGQTKEVPGSIMSQLDAKKMPLQDSMDNAPSSVGMNKPSIRMPETTEEYKWIYLDPEGKTQGSFPSIQMLDWFQKGYFPPDLRLRRTIDKRFLQLSEFTKLCGYIPFLPGLRLPPLDAEDEVQKLQQQLIEREQQASYMRQFQAQLLMQQLVQQQEQQQQQQHFISLQQQQPQPPPPQQQPPLQPPRSDPPLLNKLMQMLGTSPAAPPVANPNILSGMERPPLINAPEQVSIHPSNPINHLMAQQSGVRPQFSDVIPSSSNMTNPLDVSQKPSSPATTTTSSQNYDPIKSLLAQLQLSVQPQNVNTGNYFIPSEASNSDPLSHRILPDSSQPPQPPQHSTSLGQNSIWDVERNNIPYSSEQQQQTQQMSSVSHIWNKSDHQQSQVSYDNDMNFQIQRASSMDLQKQQEIHQKNELEKQQALLKQQELEKKKEELRLQQEKIEKQQELIRQSEFETYSNEQQRSLHHHQQLQDKNDSNLNNNNHSSELVKDNNFDCDPERNTDTVEDVNFDDFVKPKFTEKKDRKNRKAEEKRKNREAKKENLMTQQKYIPGMEGSLKPVEPVVAVPIEHDDYQYAQETQQQALIRLHEEQQAVLIEKEKQVPPHPVIQPKLAPWAKKMEETTNNDLSLAEIQKIEAEHEHEARILKEARELQMKELNKVVEEESKESFITAKTNWQQNTEAEDFLQIIEEEYRLEKARQEKEKTNKKNRKKDMGLAQASVWGSGSTNLSWASKTGTNIASQVPQQQQNLHNAPIKTVVANPTVVGFWDDTSSLKSRSSDDAPVVNKPKKSSKKVKEDSNNKGNSSSGVSGDSDKGRQRNKFEDWCTNALKSYTVQVDIPTFLSFLESIDCPFEVNDYVNSYIGEGKGPKSFAKEYLERRSKWRNSLKKNNKMEDNLMAPATAINPGEYSEFQSVKGSKAKNKRPKPGKGQKMDVSHLLGFSVASDRVNAGELDIPQ